MPNGRPPSSPSMSPLPASGPRLRLLEHSLKTAPSPEAKIEVLAEHTKRVVGHQEHQELLDMERDRRFTAALEALGKTIEENQRTTETGLVQLKTALCAKVDGLKAEEDALRAQLLVELGAQAAANQAQDAALVKVAASVTNLQKVKTLAKWTGLAGGVLTGGDLAHRLVDWGLLLLKELLKGN